MNKQTLSQLAGHFLRWLVPFAIAGGTAVLADPGFGAYIAHHPELAALVPIAAALLHGAAMTQPYAVSIQRKPTATAAPTETTPTQ